MITTGLVLSGLANGFFYALMALAFSLLFRTASVANLAEGDQAMLLAFIGLGFFLNFQVPYWLLILLVLFFSLIMGFLMYDVVIKHLPPRGLLVGLVATLGFSLLYNGIGQYFWASHEPYRYPSPFSTQRNIAGFGITPQHLLIFGATLGLFVVLYLILYRTDMGLQMRAVADHIEAAKLMGIDTDNVYRMSWMMATAVIGIAGVLFSPLLYLDTVVMNLVMYKALAASVLGGLLSLPGAVVGGILLGLIENLVVPFVPEAREAVALIIVMIILLVRPAGLFGTVKQKKI